VQGSKRGIVLPPAQHLGERRRTCPDLGGEPQAPTAS
jgi:hypothetical protein